MKEPLPFTIHNEKTIEFDYDLEANRQRLYDYEKVLGKDATPMDAYQYAF